MISWTRDKDNPKVMEITSPLSMSITETDKRHQSSR